MIPRLDRRRRERLVRFAPYGAAAVTVLFGILLLDFQKREIRSGREAERYHAASEVVSRIHLHLKDVETNQRGYLLTGDTTFLVDYRAARQRAQADFGTLGGMVRKEEEQRAYDTLRELAQQRLGASDAVILSRQNGGMAAAAGLVAEGTGRRAMDEFERAVSEAVRGMDAMRAQRERASDRRFAMLLWFIPLGTVVAAVTGFGTSTALVRHARRRTRAAGRLVAMNGRLREQRALLEQQSRNLEDHAAQLETQALELELQTRDLEETREELAAREERFRALIEESPDVILVVDAEGRITYASPPVQRVLGAAPAELVGACITAFVHPDDADNVRQALASVLPMPRGVITREARYRHADGHWCMLSAHARNLLADPAVEGIVINARDVTQERSIQAQLRQAQKMEAVGQLAGGVAHDFNNLLTSIQGYTAFASDSIGASHAAHQDLQEVLKAADLAASLTRQLLAFSRQQVTQPELLDINAVVSDSVGLLHRLLGPTITMVTKLAPAVRPVLMDPGQIRQVIMNLSVNARDAMPEGGRLIIETRDVALSPGDAAKRGLAPGPYTMISVTDTGEGMSREVQDRIFEPFFTTKEQGKGTGLGLSTTYGIVRQAGGYVYVYSEPGKGATFKVYMPSAADGDAAAVDAAPAESHDASSLQGVAVLLVEDDVSVRSFARRAMERAGCTVMVAGSGEEALGVLTAEPAVQLIVTDVVMPGMSGVVFGGHVEKQYPGTRILYTSGYPRDEISWRGRIPAHVAFIEKPYAADELVRKLAQLRIETPDATPPA